MKETTFEEDVELIRKAAKEVSEGTMNPIFEGGILHGEVRMSDGSIKKYRVDHRKQTKPVKKQEGSLIDEPFPRSVMRFNLGLQIDQHGNLPGNPDYQGSGQW